MVVLKGPYVVLSFLFLFLLLLFWVLCGVIVKSVLKSIFSIISASGFRKKTKHKSGSAVRMKIVILPDCLRDEIIKSRRSE